MDENPELRILVPSGEGVASDGLARWLVTHREPSSLTSTLVEPEQERSCSGGVRREPTADLLPSFRHPIGRILAPSPRARRGHSAVVWQNASPVGYAVGVIFDRYSVHPREVWSQEPMNGRRSGVMRVDERTRRGCSTIQLEARVSRVDSAAARLRRSVEFAASAHLTPPERTVPVAFVRRQVFSNGGRAQFLLAIRDASKTPVSASQARHAMCEPAATPSPRWRPHRAREQ